MELAKRYYTETAGLKRLETLANSTKNPTLVRLETLVSNMNKAQSEQGVTLVQGKTKTILSTAKAKAVSCSGIAEYLKSKLINLFKRK